jgi:cleavage and polyadenylation specificity factor subunit 3
MTEPDEITGLKGNTIPRKISVDYLSFSAHVDYAQNSEFIELVKAQHVVSPRKNLTSPYSSRITKGVSSRRANRYGASQSGDDCKIQGSR